MALFFNKIHKTKTVYQMEASECGACCLAMIMAYYGKYVPISDVREKTGVCRDGCKANRIVEGAKDYGLFAEGHKMSYLALKKEKNLPCIIHWKFNHFVVYEGTRFGFFYINDPKEGRMKVNWIEFLQSFTGIALLFKPNENFVKNKKEDLLFKTIISMLQSDIKSTLFIIVSGFLLVFPNIIMALLNEFFVDNYIIAKTKNYLIIVLATMVIFNIIQLLISLFRDNVLIKYYTNLTCTTSKKLINHMLKLPMIFFEQRFAGDLATRVDDCDSLCSFVVTRSIKIINNIIISICILIFMLWHYTYLTIVGIICLTINLVVFETNSKILERKTYVYKQTISKLKGVLASGLSIIQTLKSSGIESLYVSRILGYYANVIDRKQQNAKTSILTSSLSSIFEYIFQIVLIFSACVLIINKKMTVGQFVAFNALFNIFINPVKEIISYVLEYNISKVSNDRINDIMLQKEDDFYSKTDIKTKRIGGLISFENVTFGYNRFEEPILKDFNLNINKGESVAIVGKTGSGKTTLLKLLSGLYEPWSGNIKFDDEKINSLDRNSIIGCVSVVNQEIYIFSGTLRDNVTIWNNDYSDDEIKEVLQRVLLYDEITADDKLDYKIEENGVNLSGGQIQKIELARALIKKPSILILDEATSSLDDISEKEIVKNISKDNITCVIVAHRLSTIKNANNIIVMKDGKIIETGNHNDLVKKNGYYNELIKSM